MEFHVKVLAILHIVTGVITALIGVLAMLALGGLGVLAGAVAREDGAFVALPILGGIGLLVFVLMLALSIPGIVAGWGLLKFRSWARILTVVLSALHLFHVPFGTALGIYGLWVLLSNEGQKLFLTPPVRY